MQITTNDCFESAYYLLNGCELIEITGTRVNGKILCNLILTGQNIAQLQLDYLNGKAMANILNLRRMVGQVRIWISNAQRKYKKALQPEAQEVQS
jgi:hypothetical protein